VNAESVAPAVVGNTPTSGIGVRATQRKYARQSNATARRMLTWYVKRTENAVIAFTTKERSRLDARHED
jgi:hypothetical protein